MFVFHEEKFDIFDKKRKFYYKNLLHEKIKPPYNQSAFNKLFNIGRKN